MCFITQLLDTIHWHWINCNYVVHDRGSGIFVTENKNRFQKEIEWQRGLGVSDLLMEGQHLMEINVEDLEVMLGENHQ